MKTMLAAVTSLVMGMLACLGLWLSEKEFSMEAQMAAKLKKISHELVEQKMHSQLMRAGFEDFKQEVALELPDAAILSSNERLRDLASVIPHVTQTYMLDESLSRKNLKLALAFHEEKNYEESTKACLDIVSQYPESTAALEASYYLVKNFYLTSNKQEALTWSNKMLKQFPDSLWTAKAMIVTAEIYREQDRKNDAIEVYNMIINTFDSKEIKEDIKRRMADIGG